MAKSARVFQLSKGLDKLSAKMSQKYTHDEKEFAQQYVCRVEEASRNIAATAQRWIRFAISHFLLEWLGVLQEKRVGAASKLIRSHRST